MNWLLSPWGLVIVVVVIFTLATLVYWKREPIQKWLKRKELSEIEIGAGPVKAKFRDKKGQTGSTSSPQAGVSFGKGNDFSGAKLKNVAGRDNIKGAAKQNTPGGKTPGVDFGQKGTFTDAEIENVAGRDNKEA